MKNRDFDIALNTDGGELDVSTSSNANHRGILTYLRNILQAIDESRIYCGLVDNPKFNACAFRKQNHDFIAINSGTINVLLRASLSLFSHPRAFTTMGNASGETTKADFSMGVVKQTTFLKPETEKRMAFARAVFQLANSVIFCHELGHIWAGHLDFIHKEDPYAKLYEVSDENSYTNLSQLSKNAIELDADRAGISFSTCSIGDLQAAFSDQSDIVRAWFVATFLVYLIMAERSGSISTFKGVSHPHPYIRLVFSLTHACHEVSDRLNLPMNKMESVGLQCLDDIQSTWSNLRIPGYRLFEERSMRKGVSSALYDLSDELSKLNPRGISRVQYPKPSREDLLDLERDTGV